MLLAILVMALAAAAAPGAPASHHVRRIGDAELLRYAETKFDPRKMMFRQEIVGLYHGTLVVADFPCGDVCPQYTRRIIHFAVDPSACGRVPGGAIVQETVPLGIAVRRKPYCEPRILVRAAAAR